jgi:hypothetical protein
MVIACLEHAHHKFPWTALRFRRDDQSGFVYANSRNQLLAAAKRFGAHPAGADRRRRHRAGAETPPMAEADKI